uniref:Receptor ligand binding region domain-containing protein n=1 Tax=Plectus sambesii TaxID=2011161 RepID=A0A914UW62_9BILA
MAAIWNIPIVGYMSTSAALRNKTIYKTLSRVTLTSSNSLANALGLVLQHFNYSQVAIASGRNVAQMADAIKQMLVNNSITLAAHAVFDENATAEIIAASHQLQNIRENARIVIVVFGPQLSAANVFAKAVSLAGMKNNDYLYIYLTLYHGYPDYLPWIASNGTLVQEIKSYYDNSIIIDNDGYANKSVENFFIKVNRTLGFQITDLDSNYIAGYMQLYDAVYVYYKSLLAAIDQANGDVNVYLNGSYIWNLERTRPNASSPQFYGQFSVDCLSSSI